MNIKENQKYFNSKGKSRIVIQKEYNIDTKKTRVVYCPDSLYSAVKSCYIEQFVKWLKS